MRRATLKRLGFTFIVLACAFMQLVPSPVSAQPSFDTIRVQDGETVRLYQVALDWSPVVLPLPDGSAWAFFTAKLKLPTEPGAEPILSNLKVFASRFDAASATWSPATPMPGEISFGPTGVVDSQGTVHLVYTIRGDLQDTSFGSLVYMKSTPEGGWSGPVLVAASQTAGHQLSPDLTIDNNDGLHVAWQDQRAVSEEMRSQDPSNADVFVSDLNPDGTWSEPLQVNIRPEIPAATPEATPGPPAQIINASRPHLLAVGDRLVMVWSVYSPTSEIGLRSATHLEWSSRPLADAAAWNEPAVLVERGSTLIGGRFLDVASNAAGDIAMVFGRRTDTENQLYLQRLPSGSDEWSEPSLIAAGNRGSFPKVAIAGDGTIYVVYNLSDSGQTVQVGAVAVAPDQTSAGAEVPVTIGEEGQQGIASVAVDVFGKAWVIYLHELPSSSAPSEVRVLRGAVVASMPTVPVTAAAETPPAATPGPEATPAG